MGAATVGALALGLSRTGDYLEAVAVMLFYQIGELFQSYAVGKSRKSITSLMDLCPEYGLVETAEGIVETEPEQIPVGTVLVIPAGERVPIDGVVLEGSSYLDTAALTGESLPAKVEAGDRIYSGSINLDAMLKIRTECTYENSTVAKIMELVENASSRKSKSEHFISKFARFYTPIVCASALALAVFPPLIRGLLMGLEFGWGLWLYRALTFLVISCPCALVISIPLSFFAALGGAGKAGILIKGSNYLEALAKAEIMVFDKTGTMTRGVFALQSLCPVGCCAEELLELAAHGEYSSTHPIAVSLRSAYGKAVDPSRVGEVRQYSGKGLRALVDGKEVLVGNFALMEEFSVPCSPAGSLGTLVYVAEDGVYRGYVEIADGLKENSAQAVKGLKKFGIRSRVLLSGDKNAAVEQVARELGLEEFHGELLPDQKVARVEELMLRKSKGRTLVFVGDGMNDAPVLSRADVGIAMGAMGSDAAIEAADVVLMDDDPMKLPLALGIAKKCMRIVYQNTVFAIGIKVLCLLLGAVGYANMWTAIFADVGVMVLAVLNAIRALSLKDCRRTLP
jgi:Cd2+/Zn2+-exporting ATPase